MADATTIIIAFVGLALTMLIAYVSYTIYGIYKNSVKGWLSITAAMFFLMAARIFSVLSELDPQSPQNSLWMLLGQASNFVVYTFLLFGLWQMKKALEENEKVERETMARMHEFEIKHRKNEELRQKLAKGKKR